VISPDLRFSGFDARSWTNLVSLFAPSVVDRLTADPQSSDDPELSSGDRDERQGTLTIVVGDDDRVLKAFHGTHGRVTDLERAAREELPELGDRYGARRVVWLREGALDELAERFAEQHDRTEDYVGQWLGLARILRDLNEAGMVESYPRPLGRMPIPTAATLRRALDLVLPDERTLLVVLWDRGKIWTAFALRRRGGAIDRVAGPDFITRWTGPLGGDWRRDHRVIADAVSRSVAPVHAGIFCEARTMRAILTRGDGGSWARAVAVRDVIVHPTPAYVAVALGADAVRGAASRAARLVWGIDALASVAPFARLVRGRIGEIASITQTLGFNPLSALARVLRREHDDGESSAE
jgi:hypothetical protein